jgi:hypothetical protein
MEQKLTHAKLSLYAYYFLALKEIAKDHGYNLVLHGSLNRDLDLIAIPWVNDPKLEIDLINALNKYLTGYTAAEEHKKEIYLYSEQPGGRHCYVINLNRGGYRRDKNGELLEPVQFVEDPQYYLDISVTPLPASSLQPPASHA